MFSVRRKRVLLCGGVLIAVAGVLAPSGAAYSWLSPVWTVEEIAEDARAIVVGDVLSTRVVRPVIVGDGAAQPLRQMAAEVRVLRGLSEVPGLHFEPGDSLFVSYRSLPGEDLDGRGPPYLELRPGQIRAFPLKGLAEGDETAWELVFDASDDALIPCVGEALEEADTEYGFLLVELAGALAEGDPQLLHEVAGHTRHLLSEHNDRGAFHDLLPILDRHVADEQRWLEIATALYCHPTTPRPTVHDLLTGPEVEPGHWSLVAEAFVRADVSDQEERIIEAFFRHSSTSSSGVADALSGNYPRHPLTLRLLSEALQADQPHAMNMAWIMVRDPEHPLRSVAQGAAVRALQRRDPLPQRDLYAVVDFLARYGDDGGFEALLSELRRSQSANRDRFRQLWRAEVYPDRSRTVALCRIGIDDPELPYPGRSKMRYCDTAVICLQRLTGEDFGWKSEASPTEWDQAVARAKAWLAEH